MRISVHVLVLTSLCLLATAAAAQPRDIGTSVVLTSAMIPAQAP